jgi:F-type H+-transporting ATPase subunit delta
MANSRAAYRYALAFIAVARESKQMDGIKTDFAMLTKLIHDSREFDLFLRSPVVSKEKKSSALASILKGKMSDLGYSLVEFLIAKQREGILPEIIDEFNKLDDQYNGVTNVTVRSASALSAQQVAALGEGIKKVAGSKSVRLTQIADKDLIGGFTVRYEDTVWDGSVRRQLELLEQRLLAGVA